MLAAKAAKQLAIAKLYEDLLRERRKYEHNNQTQVIQTFGYDSVRN